MRTGTPNTPARRAAWLLLGLALALAVPASPTAVAAPEADCVGIVVDPGGGAQPTSGCVTFRDGLTGQDVLEDSGHKLTFDRGGFICQIDGVPDECKTDNTHFWSYYHRAPGAAADKWGFSEMGANQYTVHPGETEGWAYRDGADRTPEAVPYATLKEAAASDDESPSPSTGDASDDSDDDGFPWVLAGVIAVILVIGGIASRTAMARRER